MVIRQFTLFLIYISTISIVQSQETLPSLCCQSSTVAFAQLGEKDDFISVHQEPGTYVHHAPSGKVVSFQCADGKMANGYLVEGAANAKHTLLLFHEWYGVNEYVKSEADRIASVFPEMHVLAVDLYDGIVAQNRIEASKQMQSVSDQRLTTIIQGAAEFAGSNKIAVMGWCFGGAWSMKAAAILGMQCQASIVYYGMPVKNQDEIAAISCPVLGIFAQRDNFITPALVSEFKTKMDDAGKQMEVHFFDADHGFANPSNTRYDLNATSNAWNLTSKFIQTFLGK